MIGQIELQRMFLDLIQNNSFPRFLILEGEKGSGKRTMAREIVNMFGKNYKHLVQSYICPDNKVDTIRSVIDNSYKRSNITIFIIPDCDGMSQAAQNALLKVTEEPPKNVYFIITVEDKQTLLPTIISRGSVFRMEIYTPSDIGSYANLYLNIPFNTDQMDIIKQICSVPKEVNMINEYGIFPFMEYVRLVAERIGDVSGANSFKIADKVALKADADGYDLKMFWKAFVNVSMDLYSEGDDIIQSICYLKYASVTSSYIQKLRYKGASRQMLFDMWILDIRETWS